MDEITSTASGSFIFVLSIPAAQIEALSSRTEQSDAASRGSSTAGKAVDSAVYPPHVYESGVLFFLIEDACRG